MRAVTALGMLAALAGLAPRPAAGHDFWLEPSRFEPAPEELVAVGLRVGEPGAAGERGAGEPVPRDPDRIERFALLGPTGEDPVAGRDGADPAGLLRPPAPGRYTLVYRSLPSAVTLDAARFEAYLEEEGLDHVRAARAANGAGSAPGRERFSRCAKALLRVAGDGGAATGGGAAAPHVFISEPGAPGSAADADAAARPASVPEPGAPGPVAGAADPAPDRAVGLRLELIAEADPYALAGGGPLPVALRFEGAPLAGSLVEAYGPGGRRLAARSDRDGRVTFDLDAAGRWLVTAVHMVPAPAASGADWESVWASLAFALPEG